MSHYVIYCKHMGFAWELMSSLSVLSGSKHGEQSAYQGTNTAIKHDMKAKVDSYHMFVAGCFQHMLLPWVMWAKTKYILFKKRFLFLFHKTLCLIKLMKNSTTPVNAYPLIWLHIMIKHRISQHHLSSYTNSTWWWCHGMETALQALLKGNDWSSVYSPRSHKRPAMWSFDSFLCCYPKKAVI